MSSGLPGHQLRREGGRLPDLSVRQRRQLLRRRINGLPLLLSGRIQWKKLRDQHRRLLRQPLPQRSDLRGLRRRLQVLLRARLVLLKRLLIKSDAMGMLVAWARFPLHRTTPPYFNGYNLISTKQSLYKEC